MLLRVAKSFAAHDVKLHVAALSVEITLNERYEILESVSTRKRGRVEFHIVKRTVGRDEMIERGNGVARRGRSVAVSSRRGRNAVGNGGVCKSSVGGCARLRAERNVSRNGIKSRLEPTPSRVCKRFEFFGVNVGDVSREFVDIADVVAVFRKRADIV